MEIFTIGFTQTTANAFFDSLKRAGIRQLLDVRLNNISQLSGFAKRDDLRYFLKEICDISYQHEPILAPSQEMLDAYKKQKGTWADYEYAFNALMRSRKIEEKIDRQRFCEPTVLLCSEATAEHCHRRLVLEYFQQKWQNIKIIHL